MGDLYMRNDERPQIEVNRRKLGIKSMYFNRYLLVRYVSALLFFTNIYWLISLSLSDSFLYFIPLILIVVFLFSIVEQVKIYGTHTNNAKYTKHAFRTILFTNVILMVFLYFPSAFNQLYPFLLDQEKSKILVLIILLTGILLSTLILYRLHKIKHDQDKHYGRIKKYENALN